MTGDSVYLQHILDSIVKIQAYTAVGEEQFFAEPHWQDAVIRQLEIIGEAAKHVSAEYRVLNPEIPWRRMSGMRDVLIHNYMGVDIAVIWEVSQRSLPELRTQIEAILTHSDQS